MKTLKALMLTILVAALIFPLTVISYDYYQLPGIKDYKYMDGENFPWTAPFHPEQLNWQMFASRRPGGWLFTTFAGLVNHEGHIRHYSHRVCSRAEYRTYADRIPKDDPSKEFIKPGNVAMYEFFWWTFPPAAARQAFLIWDYYDTPTLRKDADRFLFFPTNKMVRRMGGGDRSDTPGGGDFTYDDILGREVFESYHKAIGFDYLYLDEVAYDFGKFDFCRQNKDALFHKEMPWQKEVGMEGMLLTSMANNIHPDLIPTEDKPLECVVVESISKVPGYYLSKSLTWYVLPNLPHHPAVDIRNENYDRDGNLWRIWARGWTYYPNMFDENLKHFFHGMEHIWDIKIDHRSIHSFNLQLVPYDQHDKYTPVKIYQPSNLPTLRDPNPYEIGERWDKMDQQNAFYEDFRPMMPSKPPLFLGKFPDNRSISEHLLDRDYIKEVVAREEASNKAHPNRKKWFLYKDAPERLTKVILEE